MLQESEVIKLSKLYEGNYKITSPFGPRNLNGDARPHKGIDCVGIESKNIVAPTNGLIVSSQIITNKSSPTWEWGNYVKMDDLNGFYLFYCHMANRGVKVGQSVYKGQLIGIEGQTGYSFGSHLHFEVRRKSDNVSIDPMEYFKILAEWELKHYKEMTKKRFDFDESTLDYLSRHNYPEALFEKLATIK